MALVGPPAQIAYAVDRIAPGIYQTFFARMNAALRGFSVTPVNFYRSRAHNTRVGGAANSQHLIATAFDVVLPKAQRARAVQALKAQGLIAVDEGDHIHIQAWPADVAVRVIKAVNA